MHMFQYFSKIMQTFKKDQFEGFCKTQIDELQKHKMENEKINSFSVLKNDMCVFLKVQILFSMFLAICLNIE